MREIQHKKGKVYYSMGEVSEMFDVRPSLIRFWEQKFDILKPRKNKKGNRLFTPEDVDNLALIYHLVKERGMTLAGAQMRIRQNKDGAQRDREIVDRLMSIRALLMEIREELKEDGSAAVVVPSVADAVQGPEAVAEEDSLPEEEPEAESVVMPAAASEDETFAAEIADPQRDGSAVAAVTGPEPVAEAGAAVPVPFEQPLLPDESFALAMQVTVEAPALPEAEEPVPAQPQREQPQIIEQTLF